LAQNSPIDSQFPLDADIEYDDVRKTEENPRYKKIQNLRKSANRARFFTVFFVEQILQFGFPEQFVLTRLYPLSIRVDRPILHGHPKN
jgi:hypothetical protein